MSGEWAVCPYPHCPLPEGHEGAHFLPKGIPADHPVDGPRDERGNIVHGPEERPDWHARYEGYAFRQIRKVRNTMAAELERDTAAARKSPAELERQAARLASYDDLITTLDHLKGQLK